MHPKQHLTWVLECLERSKKKVFKSADYADYRRFLIKEHLAEGGRLCEKNGIEMDNSFRVKPV